MSFTTELIKMDTGPKKIICIMLLATYVGYALNVIKLTQCDFKYPHKAEAIRFIGLIPPIGGITGYLNFGK
jgi:hypothetical protein